MRIIELFEGREAPLYHAMLPIKAKNIFEKDIMEARWTHKIPGYGRVYGNSFSRNKSNIFNEDRPVILEINQRKLSQSYKIIPLDGELVFTLTNLATRSIFPSDIRKSDMDRTLRKTGQLAEEFVIGDINNLHRYISKISLFNHSGYYSDSVIWELYLICRKYSKKWNIPFVFDKSILSDRKDRIKQNIYDP